MAFRLGFLGAAGTAFVSMLFWWAWIEGWYSWQAAYPPLWWHAHEMLFGFAMPVIAGFLLTAVATWTGQPPSRGAVLQILFGSWLLARVSLLAHLPGSLIVAALADTVFIAICIWEMARRILKVRQARNYIFLPILTMFALLNLASYQQASSAANGTEIHYGVLWLILTLIALVGGRVIPFFTSRKLQYEQPAISAWVDYPAIGALFTVGVVATLGGGAESSVWMTGLLVITGVLNMVRMARWWNRGILSEPLLWSLHLSYFFIPLSLILMAAMPLDGATTRIILHALAIGTVAGMILAMMSRVSLGHTGRPLVADKTVVAAFVLLGLAAATRGYLPLLLPVETLLLWRVSALLWLAAFAGFLVCYVPILIAARPDQKPG
jgi:uncharacterized protein involved in response to NO